MDVPIGSWRFDEYRQGSGNGIGDNECVMQNFIVPPPSPSSKAPISPRIWWNGRRPWSCRRWRWWTATVCPARPGSGRRPRTQGSSPSSAQKLSSMKLQSSKFKVAKFPRPPGARWEQRLSTFNFQPSTRDRVGGNSQFAIRNSQLPGPLGLVPDPPPPGTPLPRLTLLAENHRGYRNLCRLITSAARDSPKGKARASWHQVAAHTDGLHCLTGGAEGVVAQRLALRGLDAARRELEQLHGLFPGRLHVELQRHHLRDEEHRNRALMRPRHAAAVAGGGHRRRPLRDSGRQGTRRCPGLYPRGRHPGHGGPVAGGSAGTTSKIGSRDGPDVQRSPPGDDRRSRACRPAELHPVGPGLPLSRLPAATRRDPGVLPPPGDLERRPRPFPAAHRPCPGPDRQGARSDRETGSGRLLPDRLGHRPLLPAREHPGPGPRLGGQQRGLLRPVHHRRRPGEDGAALRTLPVRGAGRVARHRSRPALGRPAGEGDPVRLPPLRPPRRRHDRQRHHLPRPLGGTGGGQGPRFLARTGGPDLQTARPPRLGRDPRRRPRPWTPSWPPPGSTPPPAAPSTSSGCGGRSTTCRATWASTPAAW